MKKARGNSTTLRDPLHGGKPLKAEKSSEARGRRDREIREKIKATQLERKGAKT